MTQLVQFPTKGYRFRGGLRVIGFVLIVNAALTAAGISMARAHAEGIAKQAGLSLLKQIGPVVVGPPQAVTLNGQRMFLGSKVTPLDVHEVVARFEQHCRESPTDLSTEFGTLPQTESPSMPESLNHLERWLTSHAESDNGEVGYLACFAGKTGGGFGGFFKRLQEFASSGDLSRLGDMRYVVARRDKNAGKTHVLTMWTEGTFNVRAMFPKNSDVPGGDSDHAPRPPQSVRILSSQLGDLPYTVRMYNSSASRAAVIDTYAREMKDRGFSAVSLPINKDSYDLNQNARAFVKEAGAVIVVAADAPENQTVVTLLEMGSRGFAHACERETP